MNKKLPLIALSSFLLTTGFYLGNPEEDVQNFINETNRKTSGGPVDLGPIPEEKAYVPFQYTGQTSPFDLKSFVEENLNNEATASDQGCKPGEKCESEVDAPTPHEPYFLERFDLVELKMLGRLVDKKGEVIGLIRSPNGVIHHVKVGEYIGKNNGRISVIDKTYVELWEKHQTTRGGWKQERARISLF